MHKTYKYEDNYEKRIFIIKNVNTGEDSTAITRYTVLEVAKPKKSLYNPFDVTFKTKYLSESILEQCEPISQNEAFKRISEIFDEWLNFNYSKSASNKEKEDSLYILLGAVEDIPNDAYVITIEEFLDLCASGCFTDYDGFGYPALHDKMNKKTHLTPSEILEGDYDKRYTHIVWFNR